MHRSLGVFSTEIELLVVTAALNEVFVVLILLHVNGFSPLVGTWKVSVPPAGAEMESEVMVLVVWLSPFFALIVTLVRAWYMEKVIFCPSAFFLFICGTAASRSIWEFSSVGTV